MSFYKLLADYDIDELADKLEEYGVVVNQYDDGRVHFEANLFDTSVKPNDIRYDAKGIVVDSIDKKFLSIPSRAFKYISHIKESTVEEYFNRGLYNVIEAYDGTNITFYNFNSELYASTAKSGDVSNYYWQGTKTFAQMFYEVAIQKAPQFVKAVDLKLTEVGNLQWNIPENYCITLGFRHHNIHPDITDPEDVWFIRSFDRDTMLDVELPQLSSLKRNKVVSEVGTYKDLVKIVDQDIVVNHNNKLYGYILDSKNPMETGNLSYIFIPSSLYKLYQHFFYAIERCSDDNISHHNRYIYSIFRNILSNNTNYLKVLVKLLPKYSDEIESINIFIDSMITRILARGEDDTFLNDSIYTEYIDNIINQVQKAESKINIKSMEANKLVNDIVRSVNNSVALTELYLKEKST